MTSNASFRALRNVKAASPLGTYIVAMAIEPGVSFREVKAVG